MAVHMVVAAQTVELTTKIQPANTLAQLAATALSALSASSGALAVAIHPTPQTSN
jgi:hypothetical protein